MSPFTEAQQKLIADPKVSELMEKLISKARGKGIVISDDVRSDAQWSICQASKHYDPVICPDWPSYALRWIQGAIGRAARKARRFQSSEIDTAARREPDHDEVLSKRLELLRLAIDRMDPPLKEVAELRAKGLGVRLIARKLKRSFHEAREQYDAVTEALSQAFGYRIKGGQAVTVQRPLFEGYQ